MIRAIVAIYAFGLLAFPVWGLLAPDDYRAVIDEFPQAETAQLQQLQLAATIHWLKNAYLAFVFLLLARYVGNPVKSTDVSRAGWLLTASPLVLLLYDGLAQLVLSQDLEELEISVLLRSDMLLYCALGLVLVGIARTLPAATTTTEEEGAEA